MAIYRITNYIDDQRRRVIERTDIDTDEPQYFGEVDVDLSSLGVPQPVGIAFPLKVLTVQRAFQVYDDKSAAAVEDTFAEAKAHKEAFEAKAKLEAAAKAGSKILGA